EPLPFCGLESGPEPAEFGTPARHANVDCRLADDGSPFACSRFRAPARNRLRRRRGAVTPLPRTRNRGNSEFPMRRKTLLLTSGLLLVVVGYWCWTLRGSPDGELRGSPEQERAFAEIKRKGGRVRVEKTADGQQALTVSFHGPRVEDAELASLQGLTQLH